MIKCYSILLGLFIIVLFGCQLTEERQSSVIAKVHAQTLYDSDIPSWITNHSDSVQLRDVFVDKWIRDKTILTAAEKEVKSSLNIDQLVNDYRESLLMIQFEQSLITNHMDSIVTQAQIEAYYASHKNEFILQEEAVKAIYIQCNDDHSIQLIKNQWKSIKPGSWSLPSDSLDCSHSWINDNVWLKKSTIESTLPDNVKSKLSWKKAGKYDIELDSTFYFIYLADVVKPRELSPLPLIKENIIKLILHKRKKELMKEYEEKLVQEGIKNKQITLVK